MNTNSKPRNIAIWASYLGLYVPAFFAGLGSAAIYAHTHSDKILNDAEFASFKAERLAWLIPTLISTFAIQQLFYYAYARPLDKTSTDADGWKKTRLAIFAIGVVAIGLDASAAGLALSSASLAITLFLMKGLKSLFSEFSLAAANLGKDLGDHPITAWLNQPKVIAVFSFIFLNFTGLTIGGLHALAGVEGQLTYFKDMSDKEIQALSIMKKFTEEPKYLILTALLFWAGALFTHSYDVLAGLGKRIVKNKPHTNLATTAPITQYADVARNPGKTCCSKFGYGLRNGVLGFLSVMQTGWPTHPSARGESTTFNIGSGLGVIFYYGGLLALVDQARRTYIGHGETAGLLFALFCGRDNYHVGVDYGMITLMVLGSLAEPVDKLVMLWSNDNVASTINQVGTFADTNRMQTRLEDDDKAGCCDTWTKTAPSLISMA